ncbi:MAG: NAD+ synthase [Elusimicrobiota bacterium]
MKLTLAQLNTTVGDIQGNTKKIKKTVERHSDSSDIIIFSELFICGYPPRDLLEKPDFIKKTQEALKEIVSFSSKHDTGIIIGLPLLTKRKTRKPLYNSAVLIHKGKILSKSHKSLLPTYDVFDEERYFERSPRVDTIDFKGRKIGISICEDMWNEPELWQEWNYDINPIKNLAEKGAEVIINISASPFFIGKEELRYKIISNHAKKNGVVFCFVNQVGGNDELLFDGRSMAVDSEGLPIAVFPKFKEKIDTIDTEDKGSKELHSPVDEKESIYNALVMGVKDYMGKCGFSKAVVGLSGGIDSSVTCCIASQALGKENILGVSMPSQYTSEDSIKEAKKLAENLGIDYKKIPIDEIYKSYNNSLKHCIKEKKDIGITLQNIQARIRGNILMALSNEYGYLVLSTGNKSEMAVGYSTLYGDLAGGLAVISDIPKTMVYELAGYINRDKQLIPQNIFKKAPSAELKPDQKDTDTLPPYEILDKILYYYIQKNLSFKDIEKKGFDMKTVKWVINSVNKNEYKRRQAPPGLKVTSKAFGVGRRMPIAKQNFV